MTPLAFLGRFKRRYLNHASQLQNFHKKTPVSEKAKQGCSVTLATESVVIFLGK